MKAMFYRAKSFKRTLCGKWATSTATKVQMFDLSDGKICTTATTTTTATTASTPVKFVSYVGACVDGNGQRYPWCYNWAVSQDDCAATASASASAVGYEMVGSGATKGCSILYPFGQNVKQDIPCEQYNTGSFGPGFKGTGYPVGATPDTGYLRFAKAATTTTTATTASTPGWAPKFKAELKAAITECLKLSNDCSKGPHGPIGSWDVSAVLDMSYLFEYIPGADKFNADLSNWDVSSVTNMA